MQVGQGGCVADSCAWHRAVVLQKVLDEVRVFILVHLQSFFSLLFMSTLWQTAVAIEELLEGWNLATCFLQNMVPQDPSHTIDELLVAANDVFLKVFSIFADEGTFFTFNPCLGSFKYRTTTSCHLYIKSYKNLVISHMRKTKMNG